MSDGHIKIDTRLDNSKIKADLNNLEALVAEGAAGVTEEFAQKVEKLSANWSKLSAQQSKNNAKLNEYNSEMKELQRLMSIDKKAGIEVDPDQLAEFDKLAQKIKEAEANAQGINAAMSKVGLGTKSLNDELAQSATNTKSFKSEVESTNTSLAKTPKHVGNVSNGINKGIKSLMKYAGMLIGIRAIYSGIQKATNAWMQSTQEGAQAQADLQGIWESLGATIGPVIQWLISLLQQLLGYANAFTKAFFGFELFTESAKKNLGGAVGAAKELRKQLAGFDEMNVLGSNGQQNAAGGIGALTPTEIGTPDISGFKKAIKALETAVKPFIDTLKSINFEPLTNAFKVFGNSVIGILGIIGSSMIRMLNETVGPFIKLFIEDIAPRSLIAISNVLDALAPVLEYLLKEIVEPLFNWFMLEFVPVAFDTVLAALDALVPIIEVVLAAFEEVWKEIWEPMFTWLGSTVVGILETLTLLFSGLSTGVNENKDSVTANLAEFMRLGSYILIAIGIFKTVTGIVGFFVGALKTLKSALGVVKTVIAAVTGSISGIIAIIALAVIAVIGMATNWQQTWQDIKVIAGNIMGVFSGLVDFIAGVFTGDWKRAWRGVVTAFENIVSGLANIFKFPVNAIIDGLNFFIRQANKIKIPDWVPGVGGKGINISQIPRLARGGITTGATTAIIGEAGREAVVPLQNNTEWAKDFLDVLGSYGGSFGGSGSPTVIQLVVSGKTLAEVINQENKQNEFNTNGRFGYGY